MDIIYEGSSRSPTKRKDDFIKADIINAEKSLGIETDLDRLLEASLFIDRTFMNFSIITGTVEHPELIFGEQAWAGYLDAKKFTLDFGNSELTIDFISQTQSQLTKRTSPSKSGVLRNIGIVAASFDDDQKPVTYTDEQIKAITNNPDLTFQPNLDIDQTGKTGFIVYPHDKFGPETQSAISSDLQNICDWYNSTKKQSGYDPFALAAQLQQKIVSLHPYADANGTLSRLLMNWSLTNDGQPPSIIGNPNNDIFTTNAAWTEDVKKGSQNFESYLRKKEILMEIGFTNREAMFDLGNEKAFYDYIFRFVWNTPALSTDGQLHRHDTYADFLKRFQSEYFKFNAFMQSQSGVITDSGFRQITQGGLITGEQMNFANSPISKVRETKEIEELFTGIEIFRGGLVTESLDDQRICELFLDHTCVGADYKTLNTSGKPARSIQNVRSQLIVESMDYYNRLISAQYFQTSYPDNPNPYARLIQDGKNITSIISAHIKSTDMTWDSPFVSTSFRYKEAIKWATNFNFDSSKTAKHGVLFKARLPKKGTVLTFGEQFPGVNAKMFEFEQEALIAGGIHPASIEQVEIYDADNLTTTPSIRATRIGQGGILKIHIEDMRGKFIVIKTYTYNSDLGIFELTRSLTTDQKSKSSPQYAYSPAFAHISQQQAIKAILEDHAVNNKKSVFDIPIPLEFFSQEKDIEENPINKYLPKKSSEFANTIIKEFQKNQFKNTN